MEEEYLEEFDAVPSPTDDKTDGDYTPAALNPTKKKKESNSRKTARKVLHEWKDSNETSRLIAAVEKHRKLWDASSPE